MVLAATLAVSLTLAGCSSNGDKSASGKKESSTKTTLPEECAGITDPSKLETLPADCANAVLVMRVKDEGSKELKEMPAAKLTALASAVCNFGREIKASDGNVATPFADIVASNAESWGISEAAVIDVVEASGVVCPDETEAVLKLRSGGSPTAVDYVATGPGAMNVTYTGIDGNQVTAKVETPWEYRVGLQQVGDVSLTVEMADGVKGQPTCKIVVNRKELASETAEKTGKVTCETDVKSIKVAAG